MRRVDVLVIGGGQAGLAMSRCLTDRRVDHLVVERGRLADRWRCERWDSLRLLTPNWMTRLPGFVYDGPDPHGYMRTTEVVALLERYGRASRVPIVTGAAVRSLEAASDGYRADTDAGVFRARQVVIATGHCERPWIPATAAGAPTWLHQTTPADYRNPETLPSGAVLVVGASSSGLQLADELVRAGRDVVLAVGQHTRVPRMYRGRDLFTWFERLGLLREPVARVHDLEASRAQPSLQLVGRPTHDSLDLRGLASRGVRVAGRLMALHGDTAIFDDDLVATTSAADLKLASLLRRIDRVADEDGAAPAPPFVPHWPAFIDATPQRMSLWARGIRTVLWATGFRRDYAWLGVPVVDRCGEIAHTGGVTPAPGLFVLGMPFLRHRSSGFIDGVGVDAGHLASLIARNLGLSGAAA